jgi:hypothetical protein
MQSTNESTSGAASNIPAYRHLATLERRVSFLQRRIDQVHRLDPGKNTTYDEEELNALKWAIDAIHDWVVLPTVDDDLKG